MGDEKIKSYIKSKRLGDAIKEIDQSSNRKNALENALKNEEFKKFTDHCLRTLGFLNENGQFIYEPQ